MATSERVDIPLHLDLRAAMRAIETINRNLQSVAKISSSVTNAIGMTAQTNGTSSLAASAQSAVTTVARIGQSAREVNNELKHMGSQATETKSQTTDLALQTATAFAAIPAQVSQGTVATQAFGVMLTGNAGQLQRVAAASVSASDSLVQLGKSATAQGGNVVTSLREAETSVGHLSSTAYEAAFKITNVARGLDLVAASAQTLSKIPLPNWMVELTHSAYNVSDALFWQTGFVNNAAASSTLLVSKVVGLVYALKSMMHIVAPIIAVFRQLMTITISFGQSLYVLSGIATLVGQGLLVVVHALRMLASVMIIALAPFYMIYKAVALVVKGMWVAVKPILTVYWWWKRLTLQLWAAKMTMKILAQAIGILSPRLKVIIVILASLGLSAKAMAAAIQIGMVAVRAFTIAVSAATFAVKLLMHPMDALRMLMRGLQTTVTILTRTFLKLATTVYAASAAMLRFAGSTMKSALASANESIGNMLTSMLRLRGGMISMAGLAIAAFGGWGVTLAAEAETARIPYKTMLGDMNQAKKMLQEIEEFAATTPFQTSDLKAAGRVLLTAGIPAKELVNQMRILGDVASGTQKPIDDYVQIYLKVKKEGKASLESINALARRGVDVWATLQTVTGESADGVRKLVSDGKIGFTELQKAVTLTTQAISATNNSTGAGKFLNATIDQSQTLTGIWSTFKDNVGFVARDFGSLIIEVTNLGGGLSNGITMLQTFRERVSDVKPVIVAVWELMQVSFEAIAGIFAEIGAAFGVVGNDLVAEIVQVTSVMTWTIQNVGNIYKLIGAKIAYYFVSAANIIVHWVGTVIPTMVVGAARFMYDNFSNFGTMTQTIFSNLAKNIVSVMTGLWDFISSAGTKKLSMTWTPLLTGFKDAVGKMPDIPKRAVGEVEAQIADQIRALESVVGETHQKAMEKSMAMVRRVRATTAAERAKEAETLANTTFKAGSVGAGEETETGTGVAENRRTSFVVDAMTKDSAAALKAIFGSREDQTPKKQLNVLQQIAKNTTPKPIPQPAIQGAV